MHYSLYDGSPLGEVESFDNAYVEQWDGEFLCVRVGGALCKIHSSMISEKSEVACVGDFGILIVDKRAVGKEPNPCLKNC